MSLYNALHGVNPATPILMALLDLERSDRAPTAAPELHDSWDDNYEKEWGAYADLCTANLYWPTGRFRDIWVEDGGEKIVLYTRNGGGNRESYFWVFRSLRKHPQYLDDRDDDFDCTYASITFNTPEWAIPALREMCDPERAKPLFEKMQDAMKALETMTIEEIQQDERFAPIARVVGQIAEHLKAGAD